MSNFKGREFKRERSASNIKDGEPILNQYSGSQGHDLREKLKENKRQSFKASAALDLTNYPDFIRKLQVALNLDYDPDNKKEIDWDKYIHAEPNESGDVIAYKINNPEFPDQEIVTGTFHKNKAQDRQAEGKDGVFALTVHNPAAHPQLLGVLKDHMAADKVLVIDRADFASAKAIVSQFQQKEPSRKVELAHDALSKEDRAELVEWGTEHNVDIHIRTGPADGLENKQDYVKRMKR